MKPSSLSLVLDTWAVLAHLLDEPCGPRVRTTLELASKEGRAVLMSGMSVGEVCYIIERRNGVTAVQDVLSGLADLQLVVVDPDRETILRAATIKARHSISFGDAFVVALAEANDAVVVTGDPDFKKVEHLVAVDWLDVENSDPAGQ